MTSLRVLSAEQIRKAVSMKEIINEMEVAFTELSADRAKMPIRAHIEIEQPSGTALFMPSYLAPTAKIGVKTVTLFDDNRKSNLPFIQGMVSLFDGTNGTPLAVLDGMTITALRTGAVSGLATRYLAREDAKICTVFGAGVQGRTQLEAICAERALKTAYVIDPFNTAARSFAKEMSKQLGIEVIVAKDQEKAVTEADIICCATISETPVFDDGDISDGVHINAVGSYKPHVQEVPEEMVLRSKLYVDHRESALEETGDLIIPLEKGLFTEDHIIAEIGELAMGNAPGRTSDSEITFFKSVGVAVQDLAASAVAYNKAEELGIGTLAEL